MTNFHIHGHIPFLLYDIFRLAEKSILSILDYETWKPRRKLYDPAFNKG